MSAKHCKQAPHRTLEIRSELLDEIRSEAKRTGLSLSKIVQTAWVISRDAIRDIPE